MRLRAAGDMNFAEGTLWSEGGAGTNAIGTAIALDHAVQVFGPEHFSDPVQRWTCSAAPIHDPDTGAVIGVIDLTGDLSTVHPHSLAVATATARAVEASLQLALQERDARLHARYGDRVSPDRSRADDAVRAARSAPSRPAGASPAGSRSRPAAARSCCPSGAPAVAEPVSPTLEAFVVHAVESRRVTSIARPLVKLGFLGRDRATLEIGEPHDRAAPAAGRDPRAAVRAPERDERRARCAPTCTATAAASRSVRVEVVRLRKLLGPWIDTDRYRLTCDVETDVRRVEGLLAARRRARGGRGLPRPAAAELARRPASSRERERLDAWLRQAVMTADDPEALWAWVHTRTGADDLGAWKRLLTQLEFRDPRRALCAARVGELRRAALM